jgi:hypothetical protein
VHPVRASHSEALYAAQRVGCQRFILVQGAHSLPARVRAPSRADFGALAEISLREKFVIAGARSAAREARALLQVCSNPRDPRFLFPKNKS